MDETYLICIDIEGEKYIFDTKPKLEMAKFMMNKIVNMTSPPEVFSYDELKRIIGMLNCTQIHIDILTLSEVCHTNGSITVGVVRSDKL